MSASSTASALGGKANCDDDVESAKLMREAEVEYEVFGLRDEVAEPCDEVGGLRDEVKEIKEIKADLMKHIFTIRDTISSQLNFQDKVNKQREVEVGKEVIELRDQVNGLSDEIKRATKRDAQVDNELIGLSDEVLRLRDEVKCTKQREAQLETEIRDLRGEISGLNRDVELAKQREQEVENTIIGPLRDEVKRAKQRQVEAEELRSVPQALPMSRVAIKSGRFENRYVMMDGSGVTSWHDSGSGSVSMQTHVAGWETFNVIRHPNSDAVSFEGIHFPNVFLRVCPENNQEASSAHLTKVSINCQYGCDGNNEKFRLRPLGNQGEVAIEPLAAPGKYLRLNNEGSLDSSLNGFFLGGETFYLIVLA